MRSSPSCAWRARLARGLAAIAVFVSFPAAALELCTGSPKTRKRHYDVVGAGHYGIFSGRRWREMAYPEVRGFIAKYQR